MALPSMTDAEIPQTSPTNNVLFLHGNESKHDGWMNADQNDTVDSEWSGGGGFINYIFMSFPLRPALNSSRFLILNSSEKWTIRVHAIPWKEGGNPSEPKGVTGNLTVANHSDCLTDFKRDGEYYIFRLDGGCDVIYPSWNIVFNFSCSSGSCIDTTHIKVYTDGTSNVTIPIIGTDIDTDLDGIPNSKDPDDDGDGHNDTSDAYPLDQSRWEKEKHKSGFLPGFDALPTLFVLCIMTVIILRRNRPV